MHSAHTARFLSKDVTHVVNIKQYLPVDKYVIKNNPYSRSAKMVQLALQSQSSTSRKGYLKQHPVFLTPRILKAISDKCLIENNHQESGKSAIILPINNAQNLDVKITRLQGYYIKVEDKSGKYRPLVTEFTEWPELHFDSGTPFRYPQFDRTSLASKWNRKIRLCELCNEYYKIAEEHLKGPHHQGNANNDKLFAGVDALINAGPMFDDLFQKNQEQ